MIKKENKTIEILDTTLREGGQTPNVFFSISQKIKIVKLLDRFGVDFIETGHPGISSRVMADCKKIARLGLKAKVIAHARICKKDIDAVIKSGSPWVGLFFGINPMSLKYKYNISKEEALKKIGFAVRYAKSKGLRVRFTIEDATRTDIKDIIRAGLVAQNAGADRLSLADTVGVATPVKIFHLVRSVKKFIKIPLHIHCHNDFGLALANSLSAYEAGISTIDCTVNGLGERVGITALEKIAVGLRVLYGVKKNWNLPLLSEISEKVTQYSGIPISPKMPIVGKTIFTHKAGLHGAAVLKNPTSYEPFSPGLIGRTREIVIGPMSGKTVVKRKLKELKIRASRKKIEEITQQLKGLKRDLKNNKEFISLINKTNPPHGSPSSIS